MRLSPVPEPVQSTVDSIADLHAEHYLSLPKSQIGIEYVTDRLGRPWALFVCIAILALWMGSNLWAQVHHVHPWDPAPFYWLQTITSIAAFLMTILILVTENRQGVLDERRSQLTLQIALLTERKITKVVELVERIRQEHPLLSNPTDKETADMMHPADPREVMQSLDQAQEAKMKA
ncbi:MAG: DUF1003 domain-containing protein [Candidatus Baltobacteraceae bacterium]